MAGADEHNDQPEFQQQGQSQYSQAQHAFAYSNNEYPPLSADDLGLAAQQAFSQPIQQNIASQLQDAAHNGGPRNGDGSIRVNTNGASLSGVVPAHGTNSQSFSMPDGRGSIDHTPDSATPGDKSRIKAKASQACDECRRKKTKCITNVSEDGVPTPCNSCVKAGLDCQYSRQPLKRGPNKGYIKDLADRVQQVESLMHQPGYRQSFDGDIFVTGDEPMSARRNFSLPGGRTSFSGPDFGSSRGRFDSLTSAYTPLSAAPKLRDRFSIAVPPDQPLNQVNFYDDLDQRPAKRVKMSSDPPELRPISIESDDLADYYRGVHPNFPILPDSGDEVVKIAQKASSDLQHALITALRLLSVVNTASDEQANSKSSIKTAAEMQVRMENFYTKQLSSSPKATDALVYVWIAILVTVHAEYAVNTYDWDGLQPAHLVRQVSNILNLFKINKFASLSTDEKAQGLDFATVAQAANRAYCLSTLQNKLVLLATGQSSHADSVVFPAYEEVDAINNLSPSTRFVCYATKTFARMGLLVNNDRVDELMHTAYRDSLLESLELVAVSRTQLDTSSSVTYQQLEEFIKMVCARTSPHPSSLECLMPAAKLAEKLGQASTTYNPLDMHLYTACVMTFLEVLALPNTPNNEFAGPVAITGLTSIRPVLQDKANAYANITRSPINKLYWGKDADGNALINKSWAEALLQHIDAAESAGWVNPVTLKYQASFGGMQDITGNFAELLRRGYTTVLAWHAGHMCEAEKNELAAAAAAAPAAAGGGGGEDAGAAMASAAETAAAATAVAAESFEASGN